MFPGKSKQVAGKLFLLFMCSNLKELNEEYGKTKEQYEVAQKQIAVEIIKISAGKEDWEKT